MQRPARLPTLGLAGGPPSLSSCLQLRCAAVALAAVRCGVSCNCHGGRWQVVGFVKRELGNAGLRIVQEKRLAAGTWPPPAASAAAFGWDTKSLLTAVSLCAEEIEQHQLIDQHYSAIAQTAAITQPHELPLSDAKRGEFEAKFGVSWADALDVHRPLRSRRPLRAKAQPMRGASVAHRKVCSLWATTVLVRLSVEGYNRHALSALPRTGFGMRSCSAACW